jgi:hypothetical protein
MSQIKHSSSPTTKQKGDELTKTLKNRRKTCKQKFRGTKQHSSASYCNLETEKLKQSVGSFVALNVRASDIFHVLVLGVGRVSCAIIFSSDIFRVKLWLAWTRRRITCVVSDLERRCLGGACDERCWGS